MMREKAFETSGPRKRPVYLRSMLLYLLALVLLPAGVAAQEGRIVGVVVNEGGQALTGIAVSLVDTELGAFTGGEGSFQIMAPPGTWTVRATGLGQSTAERVVQVVAGETATVRFVLSPRAIDMEEILVSLSAVDRRREQVGTDIVRLDAARELQTAAVTSLSDLVNSRAPGVNIALGSGEVGTASKIRIRGASSLTQSNNPVVFIDGVRVSNATGAGPQAIDFGDGPTISRLDDLNPEDIADIQVLKGPSAAAAYGSEAAAGVLMITTVRGSQGAPQFQLSHEFGGNFNTSSYPDNYLNLTTLGGFTDINEAVIQQFRPVQNPVTGHIFGRQNPLEIYDPFRVGLNQRTSLNVRGGAEDLQYYASIRRDGEEGVLPNNDSDRISVRGNLTANLTSAIDLNFNSSYMSTDVRTGGSGRSPTSIITNALLGLPEFGYGQLPDGGRGDCAATVLYGADESVCAARHGGFSAHPDKIAAVVNRHEVDRFVGGVTLNVRPSSWFSNRLVVGIDHLSARDLNILPLDPDRPFRDRSRGEVDDVRIAERVLTFDYAGTLSAAVSEGLQTTTTLGAQFFNRRRDALGCEGRGGFAGPTATACNASVRFELSTEVQEVAELGLYVQETVDWKNYLFLTGAVRVDDHSGVGSNQGATVLPSANASWVVSRMPFWRFASVDNFRLRLAWGNAAQAPGPFDARTTFVPVRLGQGGQQLSGISPQNPGNPDLKSERHREVEGGFDLSFQDERLALSFTVFDQQVEDAIITRRVSPGTGFPGQQFVNIGRVENRGIEASVGVRILDRDALGWNANFQFSTEDPVITDMGGLEPITGFFGMSGMFHEGFAPGAYYGPVYLSAVRNSSGAIEPGSIELAPGNLDFGQEQGFRYYGRPNPTNEQSLSSTWTIGNRLTISSLFNRRAGHKRMDTSEGRRNCFIQNRSGGRMCAFRQAELSPAEQAALEGRVADAPQLFLHDATFIKLRELTARYVLPPDLVANVPGARSASLSVGGRNLVTWTDFPGVDPEADVSSGSDSFGNTGIYGELGPARMFFARLSITF
ncbi:MAG: SusC/RagA family TonB-linked outer membrane protein [Gemmatimonadota bacterium]